MEQDNKDMLIIGLKVLAGVAVSMVWFFSVPFVLSGIFAFFSYSIKSSGGETPEHLMLLVSLVGAVIACVIDLLTHGLLKKLFKYSLWVYIVQSAHVYNFTLFGVIFTGNDAGATDLSIGIMIYLIGGVLLSAGVRKLISLKGAKSE